MIRPFTCLCLVAALGAGLYLYQEKHRAQLLDQDIGRVVKQADQARDRIGLLKAEWALLNEPERLANLAALHLQLQPLQPAQYVRLDDLKSRLPAIAAPSADAVATDAPAPGPALLAQALPAALPTPAASPAPVQMAQATPPAPTSKPAAHAAPPRPAAPPRVLAAYRPAREAEPHPVFAPVLPAFAPVPVAVHAPRVQTASAIAEPQPSPYVGSALGMARTMLAAPVPVASAAALGYSPAR